MQSNNKGVCQIGALIVLQVPVRLEQKLHTGYIAEFTVHMLHHTSCRPSGR